MTELITETMQQQVWPGCCSAGHWRGAQRASSWCPHLPSTPAASPAPRLMPQRWSLGQGGGPCLGTPGLSGSAAGWASGAHAALEVRRLGCTEVSWQNAWPPAASDACLGSERTGLGHRSSPGVWCRRPASKPRGRAGRLHTPRPLVHQTPDDPSTERPDRWVPTARPCPGLSGKQVFQPPRGPEGTQP